MTKAALRICFDAHKDQVDKSGMPYVFHPFHVAEQMETEDEVCVALLHDVVEDTATTLDDIRAAGIGEEAVAAIAAMTHDPSVTYADYIATVARNPLARKVKVADLRHNSDRSRLDEPTARDLARLERYAEALRMLGEGE
jgi:(p)ppGpp synthase/HD superfamily hydrolase